MKRFTGAFMFQLFFDLVKIRIFSEKYRTVSKSFPLYDDMQRNVCFFSMTFYINKIQRKVRCFVHKHSLQLGLFFRIIFLVRKALESLVFSLENLASLSLSWSQKMKYVFHSSHHESNVFSLYNYEQKSRISSPSLAIYTESLIIN